MKRKKDSKKIKPYITYLLISIIVLISGILFFYAKGDGKIYIELLYNNYALVNSKVKNGEFWRIVSAIFIHFDLKHLGYNSIALYNLAIPLSEERRGNFKVLVIFLISGIVGNLITFAFGIEFSAGASGAVFGLLGVFSSEIIQGTISKKKEIRKRSKYMWIIAILFPVVMIIPGFIVDNINNTAHISGLLTGFLANFIFDNDDYKHKRLLSYSCTLFLIIISILSFFIGYYR